MKSDIPAPEAQPADPGREARALAQQGRLDQAEQAWRRVLEAHPGDPEAVNFLALCDLRRGNPGAAIPLLEGTRAIHPDHAATLGNLGLAYGLAGRLEESAATLRAAARAAPESAIVRLHLGETLGRLGHGHQSLVAQYRAITLAQQRGQWRDEGSTPAGLRETVGRAMRFVADGRRRLFGASLEAARAKYGRGALRRVERCLDGWLGELPVSYADPRQRPKFLYFQDLPSQPYLDRGQFPCLDPLEAAFSGVRAELESVMQTGDGVQPFIHFETPALMKDYLRGERGAPVWDAFFFWRHGRRFADNARRCPETSQLLDSLPLVHIREHAPEICFSILTPGTHILPHHGVTNVRVVAHLPLVVPENCVLRVGGEDHAWEEGRCVVFDDTYEHEAWNRGARTRVVLILDLWNPYLEEAECAALTDLVGAIGDFNRACEAL